MSDDEPGGEELPLKIEPIPTSVSGPARYALEELMARWSPGTRITPSAILSQAKELVRLQPLRFHESSRDVALEHVLDVISAYEIMGWIEVESRSGENPIVIGPRPIFAKQTEQLRGEFIGRRQNADRTRLRLQQERNELGPVLPLLSLSTTESTETTKTRLKLLGMEVSGTTPAGLQSNVVALVWKPAESKGSVRRGIGATENEAICHAAARVFLGSASNPT